MLKTRAYLTPIFLCLSVFGLQAKGAEVAFPLDAPVQSSLWVALDATSDYGSTSVDISDDRQVFLAFQSDVIVEIRGESVQTVRMFQDFQWTTVDASLVSVVLSDSTVKVNLSSVPGVDRIRAIQWFVPVYKPQAYIPLYYRVDSKGELELRGRFGEPGYRPRIYQMLPRLFGNENETRKINGTLAENGSGKFSDLSEPVLKQFRAFGFTHIWLTGVLQQATSTDYPEAWQRADDPDLLKGIAGSPYAIKDYFDVSPDYADDPERRLEEFKALTERMHAAGLKVIIDFVPNHVARSYQSDIRPELSFGESDRKDLFFHPDNNFFYLTDEVTDGQAPLRLPTVDPATGEIISESARLAGGADGLFGPERRHGRVTGNDIVSWTPSRGDWYETVKLNYGFDFIHREREPEYPSADTPDKPIPDTWKKMDSIIAYWQSMGVNGFRADMAHMVPPEFWKWMIHRAKERDSEVIFFAEAYNDDPAKVPSREPSISHEANVMVALLDAGFQAVYDDPGYDTLEHLYTRGAWANDLQDVEQGLGPFFFDNAVRYAENHDEIRLAHPDTWGGNDMNVGKPVTGTLFGLSRGPVMLYHGQEVGEPGVGREGFGGDDQRSTIFDYWSLPELNKWWNNGAADGARLSPEQLGLREWYSRLLKLQTEPALATGNTFFLNHANRNNGFYGKVEDVGPAGHWFFSYLRSNPDANAHFLIATNFHAKAKLRHIRIRLPDESVKALGLAERRGAWMILRERLNEDQGDAFAVPVDHVLREGIYLPGMEPLRVDYWQLELVDEQPEDAVLLPTLPAGKAFLGAPPLMRIKAGSSFDVDLRRYGNPGEDGRFVVEPTEGVSVELDRPNHVLSLHADTTARGLRLLPFRIEFADGREPLTTVLPLAVISLPSHSFKVNDFDNAGSVSVVGDFNGWDTMADPLQRGHDGWELTKTLPPGRYLYKYVVDGNWVQEPGNPNQQADGYGGFNSVLNVEDLTRNTEPLTPFVDQASGEDILVLVNGAFEEVHAHALPESGTAIELPAEVRGNWIRVPTESLAEGTLVRILVEDGFGQVALPVIAYAGKLPVDSWRDDIIYYAFTDRFCDGNPDNSLQVQSDTLAEIANYLGGDFAGIQAKLEDGYFEDLGVNVLWLAPLNQNPDDAWQEYLPPYRYYTGYHGYWPTERYGVEDRFGGEEALRALVDTAHSKNMKVLADLVLKHVHITNPIREQRPDLFGQLELSDGTRNLRRWNDNPYTTWFEPFLPAFDFRNPETINFLLEDSEYWIDAYNLDGYRLDAVKHIRPDFWWRFRSRMRDAFPGSNHYFVGETFQSREGINAFVGPNMLDGQFDFPLYDVIIPCFAQGHVGFDDLEVALRLSEEVYGRSVRMSALLGNHDKPRFMAYADEDLPHDEIDDMEEVGWALNIEVDDPAAYEKLKMAMTFLLTIDGVPMIYYGDEIGMTGAGDPDNRRMMRFGEDLAPKELEVLKHFALLAHARHGNPALYMGSRRVLEATHDLYAYLRAYEENRALVVFNRSDENKRFSFDLAPEIGEGQLVDIINGRTIEVRSGMVSFLMPPMASAVFTGNATR